MMTVLGEEVKTKRRGGGRIEAEYPNQQSARESRIALE
jgi:hypothetical protein